MHVFQQEVYHRPNVVNKHEVSKAQKSFLFFFDLGRIFFSLRVGFFEPVHAVVVFVDFLL